MVCTVGPKVHKAIGDLVVHVPRLSLLEAPGDMGRFRSIFYPESDSGLFISWQWAVSPLLWKVAWLPPVCQTSRDLERSILVRWLLAGGASSLFGRGTSPRLCVSLAHPRCCSEGHQRPVEQQEQLFLVGSCLLQCHAPVELRASSK